jgi:hypothetical protein
MRPLPTSHKEIPMFDKIATGIVLTSVVSLGVIATINIEKLYRTRVKLINTELKLKAAEELSKKLVHAMPSDQLVDFAAENMSPEAFEAWGTAVLASRQ